MRVMILLFRKLYLSTTKTDFTICYWIAPNNLKTNALEYIHRSRIARTYCMYIFNFARKYLFSKLIFPPAVNERSLVPHLCQHLTSPDVLIFYKRVSIKQYFIF